MCRRQVTPLVARIRDMLNGRKVVEHQRYHKELSPRDAPLPSLPGGPSHLLSANYYCDRDGRRAKEAPVTLANHSQRLLSSSAGAPVVISGTKFKKPPLAGVHYDPYCDYDREGYLVEGDRDEIWAEYNSRRKFNKPDE